MNALTLVCVVLCLASCFAARSYNRGNRQGSQRPVDPLPPFPIGPDPSLLTCEFGRLIGQSRLCQSSFFPNTPSQCPRGFFCNTPADGSGLCCLNTNPCRRGRPFQSNGDALTCGGRRGIRCPASYTCTRGNRFAVCCPLSSGGGYKEMIKMIFYLCSVLFSVSSIQAAINYGPGYRPVRRRPAEPLPTDQPGPIHPIPFPDGYGSRTNCEFGRQLDQYGLCLKLTFSNVPNDCAPGFSCTTSIYGFGQCCLDNNPCSRGNPFQQSGNVVSCHTQSCPAGYSCTRGNKFAVCCPESDVDPQPPSRLRPCPHIACPALSIRPDCRRETVLTYQGYKCLGCTQNRCPNVGGHY
ncbi:uncharacterized protein LOC133189837 [Saccostrea echinata]|uniref:uncharacterized protein LOC133189837 n=1 Tax=Saccostrea echinata TaxID=191078 RepID=UPI002A827EFE|nr:uncharacterized protein LOC133189837 [Saccostrea echinata]